MTHALKMKLLAALCAVGFLRTILSLSALDALAMFKMGPTSHGLGQQIAAGTIALALALVFAFLTYGFMLAAKEQPLKVVAHH